MADPNLYLVFPTKFRKTTKSYTLVLFGDHFRAGWWIFSWPKNLRIKVEYDDGSVSPFPIWCDAIPKSVNRDGTVMTVDVIPIYGGNRGTGELNVTVSNDTRGSGLPYKFDVEIA
jgi:hypothetical protein